MMRSAIGNISLTPENRIEIQKYPPGGATNHYSLDKSLKMDYAAFVILSEHSDVVGGPYIPMFRYERLIQRRLNKDGNYATALIRQIALSHTYFRMKTGIQSGKWVEKLGWWQSLKCAYRGEKLFDSEVYHCLQDVWDVRCNYAHEWRVYIEDDISESVKEAYPRGIYALSKILEKELGRTYEEYSGKKPTKRLPSHHARREYMPDKGGSSGFKITRYKCQSCGESFDPWTKGYKRCPECGAKHDFLEQQS
ncbi:zinc ribbon domain-containing protein [Halococcus sp. IIIV-5B]|uniref:FmdB family zinc ribbon protein n=1 Tax=Halococcus sp. IIIV-5B TaxID=2321230 RepID=UPI0011C3CEB6|nr:zinc ribbon domain-containing protein [Halococcus sp. IIIV-5B]